MLQPLQPILEIQVNLSHLKMHTDRSVGLKYCLLFLVIERTPNTLGKNRTEPLAEICQTRSVEIGFGRSLVIPPIKFYMPPEFLVHLS